MPDVQLITPKWALPKGVRAVIATRNGGLSKGPYGSANFADHVGDQHLAVAANRRQLAQQCGVHQWQWLQQVHGTEVFQTAAQPVPEVIADAVTTTHPGIACAVLTADCLPILLCAQDAGQVAAVHAGWRGLAAGIVTRSLRSFQCAPSEITAYLGPAIGPNHFEVGEDVLDAFALWGISPSAQRSLLVPRPDKPGHYFADIYGLARWALQQQGVHHIAGGDRCTYSDAHHFYSFRRDGVTGRMVSAIWLTGGQ